MLQTHAEEPKAGLAAAAPPRLGHDFSRVPIHPPASGVIQTKLEVNQPGDEYEQEADRVSEQVMRMAGSNPQGGFSPKHLSHLSDNDSKKTEAPPIVDEVLRSPGRPLDRATRDFMEPRFGYDLSQVRIHTDAKAAASAQAINALAYTVGQNMVFGQHQYRPDTNDGQRLLGHELTHTLQQGQPAFSPARGMASERQSLALSARHSSQVIQRELLAYKKEHTEVLPSPGGSTVVNYQIYTTDAANILEALQALIKSNKLGYREDANQVIIFNKGAARADLVAAFSAAGYAKAQEMSDALLDDHNISVYSQNKVTKSSGLVTIDLGSTPQIVERQTSRPLTSFEKSEAQLVFGNSLNLNQISLEEDPLMGALETARTTPWTVNFPPGSFGSSGFMSWLIHELTHSWQYQHGVSLGTTSYYALTTWLGIDTYGYGKKGPVGAQKPVFSDPQWEAKRVALLEAQRTAKKFTDFITEQQGDILRDYYTLLKAGQDTTAWRPFIAQVQAQP